MHVVPASPDVPAQPRSARSVEGRGVSVLPRESDTRAPLPDAPTHGAHSAAAPVDEPATTTGAIRTQHAAHAAGSSAEHPVSGGDAAQPGSASRLDQGDHQHGRHSAE
jgi:hypothetical protein